MMVEVQAIRKALRWSWLAVLAALLYAGVTVLLRSRENRAIDDAAGRRRAEQDRRIVEQLGGGDLKIVAFYANPTVLGRGEKGLLCYGVSNAKAVRIEPGIEPLQPSLSRCVEVRPARSTTYTLTAADEGGREASQQVEVVVQ